MSFSRGKALSQEQHQALTIFENNLAVINEVPQVLLTDICFDVATEENSCFFSEGHLAASRIPRKTGWKWNQSRSKVELISKDGDFRLSFFKLNTRKNGEEIKRVPQYKVWIFNITNAHSSMKSSFFWCERGIEAKPTLDGNFLKELSFLEKFVSRKDAYELGWLNETPEEFVSNTLGEYSTHDLSYHPTNYYYEYPNFCQ